MKRLSKALADCASVTVLAVARQLRTIEMILAPFARRTLTIFAAVIILCLLGFALSTCLHGVQSQKRDAVVAKTTGKALDRVAEKTETLQIEQKAKEDAINEIPGADTRLPDGHGAALEQLRRKRD